MRHALASVLLLAVGFVACGSFEAGEARPGTDEDAGTEAGKTTTPKDAGSTTGDGGDDASSSCGTVIEHPFDTAAVGGWGQQNANGTLDFVVGPEGQPALKVGAQSNGGLAKAFFDRLVAYAGVRSVHAEFDFAYDQIDPSAAFGCVTNLARSAPFGEARLELALDGTGFSGTGGFGATGFTDVDAQPLTLPATESWTRVSFDLTLADDGAIERKLDFGGQKKELSRFMPPGAGDFDGVHVLCGIVGIQGGGSYASIYLKDLVVTACKKR